MFRQNSRFVHAKYLSPFAVCLLVMAADYAPTQAQQYARNNRINTTIEEPKNHNKARLSYVSLNGSDDVNIQFYLTSALGFAVGFDDVTAIEIGLYNQYIDNNPKTSPTRVFNFRARRNYHFTSRKRRARMWSEFVAAPSAAKLGAYLHAIQDSYFHSGYNWFFGHLFKGSRPDQTWRRRNIEKANKAAQATYQELLAAARVTKVNGSPVAYADLAIEVDSFLRAENDLARQVALAALLQRIVTLKGGTETEATSTLAQIFQTMRDYSRVGKPQDQQFTKLIARP